MAAGGSDVAAGRSGVTVGGSDVTAGSKSKFRLLKEVLSAQYAKNMQEQDQRRNLLKRLLPHLKSRREASRLLGVRRNYIKFLHLNNQHMENSDRMKMLCFSTVGPRSALSSVHDTTTAIRLVHLCALVGHGGFNLRGWVSKLSIEPDKRAKCVKSMDVDSPFPAEKALGERWDTAKDTLGIHVQLKDPVFTRRGLLKVTSSVFDPLGMVCPFVLLAKLIFQEECRTGKGWDDEVKPDNFRKWKAWLGNPPNWNLIQFPDVAA